MEGKLYKSPNGEHHYLTVDGKIFAEIGGHPLKSINQALSLKNCKAIENGYDLDEIRKLADEDFECELGDGPTTNESINSMIKKSNANGAEWGFKKALEILGDKKFSAKDIRTAYSTGYEDGKSNDNFWTHLVKSLQQTEWDVEIVMEENCPYDYTSRCTQGRCDCKKPKLDSDGCLILKRK